MVILSGNGKKFQKMTKEESQDWRGGAEFWVKAQELITETITLDQFKAWFYPSTWNLEETSELIEIIYEIKLKLAEGISERDLRTMFNRIVLHRHKVEKTK